MFLKRVEILINFGLSTSVCSQNWSLLFCILYFLDPRPEIDAHIHMAKALCIKNLQLNLLLASFSFLFFVIFWILFIIQMWGELSQVVHCSH